MEWALIQPSVSAEAEFFEILNDFGKKGYGGPCPPSGTHRYFFKVYALDKGLSWKETPDKHVIYSWIKGFSTTKHILDKAELIGLYKKGL